MPTPRKYERHQGRFFVWALHTRDGVFWADGRANPVNAGRHSLGTKDRRQAVERLPRLDLTVAIERGLAPPEALAPAAGDDLPLDAGRALYEAHAARSRITGGTRRSTQKRYRAVFDKLLAFLRSNGITAWNRVTANVLERYLTHLEADGYSYATQYLEGTLVKQVVNHLVAKRRLPAEARITLRLPKPQGTDAYCWRPDEALAILAYTQTTPDLEWLHALLATLTYTGLRIGEAVALRWSDIDLVAGTTRLVDESTSARRTPGRPARTTKGGRDRVFPLNPELRPVLERLPRHPDGFVFHGPNGGRLKADTVRNVLIKKVLTPLADRFPTPPGEVGFANGRLHSFRHFFCSLCANQKVPQQVLMVWLGHRDSKLVSHYYHLHDDEAQRHMRNVRLGPVGGAGDGDANNGDL